MNHTRLLIFLLFIAALTPSLRGAPMVKVGDSIEQIVAVLGPPNGKAQAGSKTIYMYDGGNIIFKKGKAIEVPKNYEAAAEQKQKERELRTQEELARKRHAANQKAKGLVLHNGQWMTPKDRDSTKEDARDKLVSELSAEIRRAITKIKNQKLAENFSGELDKYLGLFAQTTQRHQKDGIINAMQGLAAKVSQEDARQVKSANAPKLLLLKWYHGHPETPDGLYDQEEQRYIGGDVKNISTEPLHDILVSAQLFSSRDEYRSSSIAPLDITPLLPGETSSFQIFFKNSARYGSKCKLSFRTQAGQKVRHKEEKPDF